ncbi:30S ribosomal protein S21, chloroplastic-like [Oryza glaberrima]|nr:30S ribosomal protein S21, chloroplastic-like [Oryza glaberrima]
MRAAAAAAATATAGIISPPTPSLLRANTRATFVSFPRRSPPTTSLLAVSSAPAPPSANPKYHNAKMDAGDEEVDVEELLQRFRREVARAGVMEEIRWRRRHEDARDKRKRKARSAARRFRRRHFKGPYPFGDEQEPKEGIMEDDKHDNWELPGGELPSYR